MKLVLHHHPFAARKALVVGDVVRRPAVARVIDQARAYRELAPCPRTSDDPES